MAHKTWNFWTGLATLGAISVILAVGWWLGHRSRAVEVNSLKSEIASISSQSSPSQSSPSQSSVELLRAENDDLIHFVDEVYALLQEEGIHIQLDLEVDKSGHLRLRADSAKVKDALKAKLREINEN